jgi:negative regulator of sigma-B (phosphoserine phosphatase)
MAQDTRELARLLEWGVATRPLAGETESGDRHLVRAFPNGVLVAVVDGLGHGKEAAAAAREAISILEANADQSVLDLVQRCHEGLRKTRGVVMSLASFNAPGGTLAWLGVGNVEGMLLRADPSARPVRETVLLRGGVVGDKLPPLRETVFPVGPRDLLILATDGVRGGFAEEVSVSHPPQRIADSILARHATGADDALVLAACYVGAAP